MSLQQAKSKLSDLIEDARTGNIVPIRLTGQLEEIMSLIDSDDEPPEAVADVPADGDVGVLKKESAEFISTAVHELRTPMTSIRGYSDMLNTQNMGELNDMQQQFVTTIRANARRMEGILQDVSDISKIRAGTLKITEKMDMFKNIAMVIEKDMQPLAEELGKTLNFDIPQGLPLLNTDGEHFAKAVRKFVENSLRYSDDDGVVSVRAHADDSTLVVTVEDNGIGMSPEEKQMLGQLYWRADHDKVREFKGSGLGIPIAYGIIDLLDGKVDVKSTPEEGTTVSIRLDGMT